MALINPLRDVTLISPLEWDAWDKEFRTKAKSNDLWAHIDPSINGKKLLERPTKPKISDFSKHIHQSHQETPTPTEQKGGRHKAKTKGIQKTHIQINTPKYPPTKELTRSILNISPED